MKSKVKIRNIKRCKCGSENIKYNYFKGYNECIDCKRRIDVTLNDY